MFKKTITSKRTVKATILNPSKKSKMAKWAKDKKTKKVRKAKVDPVTPAPVPQPGPQPVSIENYKFDIGTRFMLDTNIYTVKAGYNDSNTEFRKIYCHEMGEEVVQLESLMADKQNPSFRVI
jgi:hypothetical protein